MASISLSISKWRKVFVCLQLSINVFRHRCVSGWKNLRVRKNATAVSEKPKERKTLFWQFSNFLPFGKPAFSCFSVQTLNWPWAVRGGALSSLGKIHSNPSPTSSVYMHSIAICSICSSVPSAFHLHWASCGWGLNKAHSSPSLPPYRCSFLLLWTPAPELRWRTPNATSSQKTCCATLMGNEGKVLIRTKRDQDRQWCLLKAAEMQQVDVNAILQKGQGENMTVERENSSRRKEEPDHWEEQLKLCSNVGGNTKSFKLKPGIRQRGEDSRTPLIAPCALLLRASFYGKVHFKG